MSMTVRLLQLAMRSFGVMRVLTHCQTNFMCKWSNPVFVAHGCAFNFLAMAEGQGPRQSVLTTEQTLYVRRDVGRFTRGYCGLGTPTKKRRQKSADIRAPIEERRHKSGKKLPIIDL